MRKSKTQTVFTYGMLMDMRRYVDNPRRVGSARVKGYRLEFDRYAVMREDPAGEIYGVAWEVTLADLAALDEFERAPLLYHRIPVSIITPTSVIDGQAYHSLVLDSNESPDPQYFNSMLGMYQMAGFPVDCLYRALENTKQAEAA